MADDPVVVEVAEEKATVIVPETTAPAKTEEKQPAADTAKESVVYVVKPGDTLSFIAKKFYHNGARYDLILKANPQLVNPNALRPGMKLQIPQL